MPILILLKYDNHDCRTYYVADEKEARDQYLRRIEKDGWYADRAYIVVGDGDGLPLKEWLQAHTKKTLGKRPDL